MNSEERRLEKQRNNCKEQREKKTTALVNNAVFRALRSLLVAKLLSLNTKGDSDSNLP